MRSAYLVSLAPTFEDDVWRAATELGALVRDRVAQVHDEQDRLLTVFGGLDEKHARDSRDDLVASPVLADVPQLDASAAVAVECRSAELFASWVGRLAALLPEAAWVVDGDGVVWPADAVDPQAPGCSCGLRAPVHRLGGTPVSSDADRPSAATRGEGVSVTPSRATT